MTEKTSKLRLNGIGTRIRWGAAENEMNLREVALLRIAESERPSKKFFS
ncbi:MAG: hypothetical protein M3298_00575 [Thermoproteota archaeon]|nr:hypothetical protein [Thermoproteota archaeon]MDQ3806640.1 hypothetical protein [Thermoproteota archaeon]